MIVFAFFDGSGMVLSAGRSKALPEGATLVVDYIGTITDLTKQMLVNGELTPRPLLPEGTTLNGQHSFSGLPPNTRLEVIDVTGDEIMLSVETTAPDTTEDITFTDPGTYRIEITPPVPYLPMIKEVIA